MDISINDLALALKNCLDSDSNVRKRCEEYMLKVIIYHNY